MSEVATDAESEALRAEIIDLDRRQRNGHQALLIAEKNLTDARRHNAELTACLSTIASCLAIGLRLDATETDQPLAYFREALSIARTGHLPSAATKTITVQP